MLYIFSITLKYFNKCGIIKNVVLNSIIFTKKVSHYDV